MNPMTRRDCARNLLGLSAPALLAAGRQSLQLENSALRLELILDREAVAARSFTNKLANDTAALPPRDFLLEFDNGTILTTADFALRKAARTANGIDLLFVRGDLEVRVGYDLPAGKPYVRKRVAVRHPGGPGPRLMRADLENWQGVRRQWRSMRADLMPYASHPIFTESLWAGVEFVAAFNEYGRDGFVLRSRPGGKRVGAEWLPLHATVTGCAEPGRTRDAFLAYIDDVRLAPPRWVACYNSWWTLDPPIHQADLVALARELKQKLHDPHGVFFDVFAVDEGWALDQSIWQVNRKELPNGFADLRAVVESAGGKLGLWMSPSALYPKSTDYKWAEQNGYTVLWHNPKDPFPGRTGVSLADPRYRRETLAQLHALVRENGFEHVKFDGFTAREEHAHHDLLPGLDSVEPLAAYSLELMAATRQENPRLVTEPTYMNSWANYISPWIMRYSDTVWANAGGDCPIGVGPAPDYRESQTNAREFFIFSSLDEVWLPQNAVQYFDIVHCDAGAGFANHAAMAVARGRFFLASYINPKFVSGDEWRIYAGLLKWARTNRELLRHTVVLSSRVERGEPYAYAHWQGHRGIVAVRNPANIDQDYRLDLAAAGAPRDLADAVCYTQYPYRRGLATGVTGTGTLTIKLAPWELLFIEVTPRAQLREPVAVGARWYRDSAGRMSIAADPGAERVRVFEPGGAEIAVPATPLAALRATGEVLARSLRKLPETEWLRVKDRAVPSQAFELECAVTVPAGAKARVLLLADVPGQVFMPSRCSVTVNGAAVEPAVSSSENVTGYYSPVGVNGYWSEIVPHYSRWSWYGCEAGPGASRVRFSGVAADHRVRLGLWLWTECDAAARARTVNAACTVPEMPQYREYHERSGACLLP